MEKENHNKNDIVFSNDEIKELKKLIDKLHENEHIEIFKIIKNDTDKYTENRNGIFINMSKLNCNTLIKINNFVSFCNENTKSFQNNNDKMKTIKNLVSEDNDNTSTLQDNFSYDTSDYESKDKNINYTYTNNQDFNLNDIETTLLKESIHTIDNTDDSKRKKKYTGTKGRIIKKSIPNNNRNSKINNSNTVIISEIEKQKMSEIFDSYKKNSNKNSEPQTIFLEQENK